MNAELLILKGCVASLPAETQAQIMTAADELRAIMTKNDATVATMALALVCAESFKKEQA